MCNACGYYFIWLVTQHAYCRPLNQLTWSSFDTAPAAAPAAPPSSVSIVSLSVAESDFCATANKKTYILQ